MTENFSEVSPDISTYPVVIAIARDFGAEGHEIGKMLSVELGIPLYDNEVLVRAAMRAGVTTDQIAAYDESLAAEVAAFLPDRVDTRSIADKLFKQMEDVIRDLGSSESCIIEGRLSDYILRDNPNLITVLVTAPLEARVEIVRSKRDISEKKARKLVKRMQRAREISSTLLDFYDSGQVQKIFVIYTDMKNAMTEEAKSTRLLPFHRQTFASRPEEKAVKTPFRFEPSIETVLDTLIPSYVSGFLYSALVDSFCSEQNARMTAMRTANDNAEALLATLSSDYQRLRQAEITQEITEITAGAAAQRRNAREAQTL